MQSVGLVIGCYKPNIHCWGISENFKNCYLIENMPKKLKEKIDVNNEGFFNQNTLKEIIDIYEIQPIQMEDECYVHGYIDF